MKGLLVYTKEDAVVNHWFIGHLIEVAKGLGAELSLVVHNHRENFHVEKYGDVDFCINRSRLTIVNKVLEEKGVPCFNNLKTVEITNDKYKTYELCKELSVPVMETCLYSEETLQKTAFPCVLKAVSGHGGSEVFWLENSDSIENIKLSEDKKYILQKPCSHTGVDVRVYTLGGRIVSAVKRSSPDSFRSNYSLGGNAELFEPTHEQAEIVSVLQRELRTDYAGFDFILHNGHWVLNEIEDAVGARMLYTLCNRDIGEEYLRYIINKVSNED